LDGISHRLEMRAGEAWTLLVPALPVATTAINTCCFTAKKTTPLDKQPQRSLQDATKNVTE